MIERIIKRNGEVEDFSPRKLNGWGEWASKTLGNHVDWSEVVLHVASTLPQDITSEQLQQALIDHCLTKATWSYNRMAGRLYAALLYKKLYNGKIPTVKELFSKLVNVGLMDVNFFKAFSDDDYVRLESIIDHKRDLNYAHYQIEQSVKKYALKNRADNVDYETPQFSMLRVAMRMCMNKGVGEARIARIKRHYDQYSKDKVNVPTPYYTNSGTVKNGFQSCCLHHTNNTVGSLAASDHISYMMTVSSAGQGSKIYTQSIGSPVRGGSIVHQGKTPYYRAQVAMINANLQNGRGGAETQSYDVYDPEIETIQKFKNPMTPTARQVRGLDYAMCFNKFFAQKAANNEDYALFDFKDTEDLYKAMANPDTTVFEGLYNNYIALGKAVRFVNAREVLYNALSESVETGRHYLSNLSEMNRHTPFKSSIFLSNLCVAPETQILTDQGYLTIGELEGKSVNVWNGEQWSQTTVVKTGENQKLISVRTSSNQELVCTEYHKFYVQTGYSRGKIVEKRASELKVGDKLIKFDLPIISGEETLSNAYTNGFYSGDGCYYDGVQMTYLYHGKRDLLKHITDVRRVNDDVKQSRILVTHNGNLKDKFFVPLDNYTVDSRLQWLSGLLDSDGTVARNGTNESLQVVSTHLTFLREIQLMLQTLGVSSKINSHSEEGVRQLPLNDGSGLNGDFHCQEAWRLLISSSGLFKLSQLGLETFRLSWVKRLPQRNAEQFVTVKEVVDDGRFDDTYCVNEPKRHMVMFNGILTGNCQEIALSTKAYDSVEQLYKEEESGEVAMCSLAGINVGRISNDEEYKEATWVALDMIHTGIKESDYVLPQIGFTAKKRMSAGVGIVDLAYAMAKRKLKYSSEEGRNFIHELAETHYWYLLESSLKLSEEFGNAEWIDRTKWVDGWLPTDTYNKHIDEVVSVENKRDWESMRKRIVDNKGHAFSVLAAHMPAESSSIKSGATNSVYPVRDLDLSKSNDTNVVTYVVPESEKFGKFYEIAWDVDVEDMAKVYGIIQKFTDQAISADMWYSAVGSDKISSDDLMRGFFSWVYYGVKTRYYVNTKTAKGIDLNSSEVVESSENVEFQPESNSDCEGCQL